MSLISLSDANRGQHIIVVTHAVDGQGASANVTRTIVPDLGVPFLVLDATVEALAAGTATATAQLKTSGGTNISDSLDLAAAGAGRSSFTLSEVVVPQGESLDVNVVTNSLGASGDLFIQVVIALLPS